jgi:S1-C subfamily serine protease
MGDRRKNFQLTAITALASVLLVGCANDGQPNGSASATQAPSTAESATLAETPAETVDPYAPPKDVKALIETVKDSVVIVTCGNSYGTGWVINTSAPPVIRPGRQSRFVPEATSLVVTVHHVIDGCIKKPKKLAVFVNSIEYEAELLNWNKKNDIALLALNANKPGLVVTRRPAQGTWAMSVGFPLDFINPVPELGSIIDAQNEDIIVQMPIQPGNSGSPLVNSEGKVTGTIKSAFINENEEATGWCLANSLIVLCDGIFDCSGNAIYETADADQLD